MMGETYLPVPCVHPLRADNRKVCDNCRRLWESCYRCLCDGFRFSGQEWHCPRCTGAMT